MKFKEFQSIFLVIIFFVFTLNITNCLAIQITAQASGLSTPQTTANQSDIIQNGDFQIFRTNPLPSGNRGYLIGDGINDFTRWIFDFTQDPSFSLFNPMAELTSADLLLKLIPKGEDFSSDFVRIDSLPNINISGLVPNFTINNQVEVSINLLKLYNSNSILSLFKAGAGSLAMRYEDDAIVTYARLSLSATAVPEPETYLLLLLTLGYLSSRYRLRPKLTYNVRNNLF